MPILKYPPKAIENQLMNKTRKPNACERRFYSPRNKQADQTLDHKLLNLPPNYEHLGPNRQTSELTQTSGSKPWSLKVADPDKRHM